METRFMSTQDTPNPTEEQYKIAKALVEAYEANTGEKVVSATITWDDIQNDYLKRSAKVFPVSKEHQEIVDKMQTMFKGKC